MKLTPIHGLFHYQCDRTDRTIIKGRPMQSGGPLCDTGDGHYNGAGPHAWEGRGPAVNCPRCIDLRHLISPRERDKVDWDVDARPNVATLSARF